MRRHVRDPYVKQAVARGYRSRAAFKLIELDRRDRLLRPGMIVLDLGAAPGGWSQIAAERVQPGGRVVAVDVLPLAPMGGVVALQGDIGDAGTRAQIMECLDNSEIDLVLSDMAPNLTGVPSTDEARSQALVLQALELARAVLKPDGCFLVKVFHGRGLDAVIREMKKVFAHVAVRKPAASRSQSSEVYILCRGPLRRVEARIA